MISSLRGTAYEGRRTAYRLRPTAYGSRCLGPVVLILVPRYSNIERSTGIDMQVTLWKDDYDPGVIEASYSWLSIGSKRKKKSATR